MGGGGLVLAAGLLSTQTEPDAGTEPTSGPLGTPASFPFLKLRSRDYTNFLMVLVKTYKYTI